jgi:hypothetical protein
MKRLIVTAVLTALLCACAGGAKEPIIEIDMRAQNTPRAVQETPDAIETHTQEPTEAPQVSATDTPTDAPEGTAAESYAQRVIDAWREAGLLENYAPYAQGDLLDLYGIDLNTCIGGAGFAEAAGYTNEIVLVETDEATAADILSLLEDHVDMLKAQFRSYDAAAYATVEKAVLLRENGVVLLIVSPDAEALLNVFRGVNR